MKTYKLKAFSICNEINFDEISIHFGIQKEYKWEEFLTLNEEHIHGIINNAQGKKVKIFPFGSIVFINCVYNEMMDIFKYLQKLEIHLENIDPKYTDDYELDIASNGEEPEINYDNMIVEKEESNLDIVSIILAKSVAMERVEAEIEKLIDESETIINSLEKGKLDIKDKKLLTMTGEILKFRHNTISYIMLLDKPDVTWKNQVADEIYIELSHIFELDDRYITVTAKTEILMDIVEVFTSLMHSKRGNKLELTVIILIAAEIVIMLTDYFK